MSPIHLLLAVRQRSNNLFAPVLEESVHRLGERVQDSFTCMPDMHKDGQEVEFMYSRFVVDVDTDIAVPYNHVRRHVDGDRKFPALSKSSTMYCKSIAQIYRA